MHGHRARLLAVSAAVSIGPHIGGGRAALPARGALPPGALGPQALHRSLPSTTSSDGSAEGARPWWQAGGVGAGGGAALLDSGYHGQQRARSMRTMEPGCVRCTSTCQMQQVRRFARGTSVCPGGLHGAASLRCAKGPLWSRCTASTAALRCWATSIAWPVRQALDMLHKTRQRSRARVLPGRAAAQACRAHLGRAA